MTDSAAFHSASRMAATLREQRGGALDLLEQHFARIEAQDGRVNAVVVRDFARARERARAADAALARYDIWGPLHGVPMTVKESYDIAGLPTCWGSPALRDNMARHDAVVVERLKRAGAIIFGKTNVPVMLADFQAYNPVYGTTRNPWDPDRVPGGSSGGSAAALAAGFAALEAGSDIGGSIRFPAHYCGVYGHKPSWGIVPPRGHSLPGSYAPTDISVVGPLARSAEDLALALEVMAGADEKLAAGWRLELPLPRRSALRDFRVAVWRDDASCPVGSEVAERLEAVIAALARAGARIDDKARPEIDAAQAHALFIRLLWSVMAARSPIEEYERMRAEVAALAPEDESRAAQHKRASVLSHRDWLAAHHERTRLRHAWRAFFENWDVLLCPVAPTPAFPHDHSEDRDARQLLVDGEKRPYWDQLFWSGIAGLCYLPATVAPAGRTAAGLPVGIQIIGPEFGDRTTIEFARLLGEAIGGFTPPPGFG
ncbi:MAG TPA: amidase [Stellaceae bacterium]|nr:amidase [Stellaceae bacterium]